MNTTYIGAHFEWSGATSTMKKYYYAGSVRVAVRTGDTSGAAGLLWLLGDHLGSTSVPMHLLSDYTLEKRAELRYYMPWGENRASGYAGSSTPTNRRYIGQVKEDIGLHFYNARWHDSSLGWMAHADTVVPI